MIRSTDLAGNESVIAQHHLVIDTVAPASANITKLYEDSGEDSADGITNAKRLTLEGTGAPGTYINITRNGAKFGKTQVGSDGTWKLDGTNVELLDGRSAFAAIATDLAGNSAQASADFLVIIDTRAPLAPRTGGISPDTGNPRDRITAVANPSAIGVAEANAKVLVYLDGVAIGSVMATAVGTWKYDLPVMSIGSHTVAAVAIDRAGNVSPTSQIMTLFIDSGLPGRPIFTGISNDTGIDSTDLVTRASSFSLIGTVAEPNLTIRVYRNGVLSGVTKSTENGSFTVAVSGLVEAEYQFTAESINTAGTSSGEGIPLFVAIDLTAPGTPENIIISDDLGFNSTDMLTSDGSISVGGVAEPGSLVEVLLAGQSRRAYADDETGSFSVSYEDITLSDGAYSVQVLAYDVAGNRSARAATATVRIDTSAPSLLLSRLETDTGLSAIDFITSDTTPTLIGSAEAGSTVVAKLFDSELARTTSDSRGAWVLPLGMLQSDFYNLVIVAIDAAGNESRVPVSLVVDAIAPDNAINLSISPDTGVIGDFVTSSNSVVLSGLAEINSTISLKINGIFNAKIPVDLNGKWSGTIPLIKDGSYSVAISVIDTAGNSNQQDAFTITRDSQAPSRPVIREVADSAGTPILDAITSSKYVVLSGSAEPNSLLNIFSDTKIAGSLIVDSIGSWTFSLPALGGKPINQFAVVSIDAAGNNSPNTNFVVIFDATPPSAPKIFGILDGAVIDADSLTSSKIPTVRGQSEPNSRVRVTVDGVDSQTVHANSEGVWSALIFGLNDGVHRVVASAIDQAGNQGIASAPYQFTLDTSAPSAPGIDNIQPDGGSSDSDGIIGSDSIVVSGHAEPLSTLSVKLGSLGSSQIIVPNNGQWSINFNQIPDGVYVLDANTIDAAGNLASAGVRTIVIDTSAPAALSGIRFNVDSGISNTDGITNQQPQMLSGRGEPGSLVEISAPSLGAAISTMVLQDGSWSAKLALLAVTSADQKFPQGSTSLVLKQTDQAGNTSTATEFVIVVDDTAPDTPYVQLAIANSGLSVGSSGSLSSSRPTIQGLAEPESRTRLEIHSATTVVSTGTVITDSDGKWVYVPTKDLPDGSYSVFAYSTDAAGNESVRSVQFELQLDTRAPQAPSITAVGPDSGSSSTDNLTREASRIFGLAEAGSTVRFFEVMQDGARSFLGEAIAGSDRNVSLELSGSGVILGHGRHQIVAVAIDAAGNTGFDSALRTIEIDSVAPETPEIVSISDDTGLAGDGVTSDTTQIISGIAEAGSIVSIRLGGPGSPVKTALAGLDGFWTVALTLPEGIQTLEIITTDRAGNSSSIPAIRVLVIDKTAPLPPSSVALVSDTGRLSSDGVTSNNLPELAGKAEPGSVIRVRYGSAVNGANQTFGSVVAGTNGSWSIAAPDIFDDGKYLFEIEASDLAGNLSAKTKLSVTIDSVAPAATIAFPMDGGYYNLKSWSGSIKGSAQSLGGSALARVIGTVTDNLGQYYNGTSFANAFVELTATGTSAWSLPIPAGALVTGHTYTASFVVEDLAGNRDSVSEVTFNFDTVSPVISLNASLPESNLVPQTLVIDFGEPVRSFPLERLSVSDGLTVRQIDQSAGKFTLSLTPSREGVFSVKLPAGAVLDISGNPAPGLSFVTSFDISTSTTDSQKLEFSGSGAGYSGQFGKVSDQDWFRVVAPFSGGLSLNLSGAKSLGTSLKLLDSNKNDIALADNSASASSSLKINVIAGEAFYIGAGARGLSTGAYSLSLALGDPFLDDFGNSVSDTGGLPASGTGIYAVRGEINKSGDVDYFKFVASATGMITFRASPTGSSALIPSLAGGSSENVFTSQTETESRILNQAVVRFPVISGSTYFVKVGSHLASGVESVGTYILESTFAQGGIEATDDQSGLARKVDLSGSVRSANYAMRLEATGDADGFEIVLPEAGRRLLISLDSWFECRVVVGSGSFEKSFVTQNGRLLLDGIYTDTRSVPVRVFASGSSGEYRLSVAVDEFSGDFASAKSINPGPIGDVYSGGIQLPGDIDNLAVQILQTGKVIARLDPVGEVFDVSVDIVDGSGAVIGTSLVNPDYSVTVSASVSFGDSIFVRVRGNNGSAGRYKLFVQQVPDDFEDTIANASVFAGSVSGNLDFQSDKDVFEFVVNSSGSYVFHTRPDIGSKAEPSLNVIRRGQIVSSVDANVPNSSGLVTVDLVAGEHVFVEVAGFGRLGRYLLDGYADGIQVGDDFPNTINMAQNYQTNVLVPGQDVSGSISPDFDSDFLRFNITESGKFTIGAGASSGSKLDARLSLFQKDISSQTWQLLATDDDGGDSVNAQIFQALDAGDYLVRVGSSRGTMGSYSLSLNQFVTQSQTGPDDAPDNPAKATIKSFVTTPQGAISIVNGTIERGTDLDYYQFKSPNDGTLIINLARTGGSLDPVVGLYDSYSAVETTNDNSGPGTTDSRLVVDVVKDQIVVISAGSFGLTTGTYRLTVALEIPVADDFGQSPVSSGSIPLDGVALLDYVGDRDVFKFDPAIDGILTVHLDNVVGVSNPRIRILDNHSAVLAEDVAGGFGLNSLLSIRVNVGIPVYIEAASVLGEIGSYKVSARLVDDDYANDASGAFRAIVSANGFVLAGKINSVDPAFQESGTDADWFAFKADRSGLANVRVDSVDGLNPYLFVYNSSLDLIGSQDNRSDLDTGATVPLDLIEGHTYYVRVVGTAGSTGSYTLESRPVVDDHGNSLDSSTALVVDDHANGLIAGAIDTAFDQDYFRFTPSIDSRIAVTLVAGAGSNLDSNLSAFDSNGRLIVANDDATRLTKDSLVEFSVQAGQTYYLRAQGFGSSEGLYQVVVSPIAEIDDEFGDTADMAESWALASDGSGYREGALQSSRDIDLLKVVSPLSGVLELNATIQVGNATVRLFARNGNDVVQVASATGTGLLELNTSVVEAREYFIRIDSVDGDLALYSLDASVQLNSGSDLRPVSSDVIAKLSDEFNAAFVRRIATMTAGGDINKIQNEILSDLVRSYLLINGTPDTHVLVIYLDPVDFAVSDGAGREVGRTTNGGAVSENPSAAVSSRGALDLVVVPVSSAGSFNMNLMGVGGGRVLAGATMITPTGTVITPRVGFNGGSYSTLPAGDVPKEGLQLVLDFSQGGDSGGNGGGSSGGGGTGTGTGGTSITSVIASAVNSTLIQTLSSQVASVIDIKGLGELASAQATAFVSLLLTASTVDGSKDAKDLLGTDNGLMVFLSNPVVQANLRAVFVISQDVSSSLNRGVRFITSKIAVVDKLVASASAPLQQITGTVLPGKVRVLLSNVLVTTGNQFVQQIDISAAAMAKVVMDQAAKLLVKPVSGADKLPSTPPAPVPAAPRSAVPPMGAMDRAVAEFAGDHPDLLATTDAVVDDSVWGDTEWICGPETNDKNGAGALTAALLVAGFLTPAWLRDHLARKANDRRPITRLDSEKKG
ncbi:MAG: Ig-like domain-containing protein [Planctomycetota bacterium]